MATFSCMSSVGKYLEIDLEAWNEGFQPQLMFQIRSQMTPKPDANVSVPIYMAPTLINNIKDPMNVAQLQINTKFGSNLIGRKGNEFVLNTPRGNISAPFTDQQYIDINNFIALMYNNASLVRCIAKNVRLQVMNVLRQVGIDTESNGRYRTTNYYDNNYASYANGTKVGTTTSNGNSANNFNNTNNNNFSSNNGFNYNNNQYSAKEGVSFSSASTDAGNINSHIPMGIMNPGMMPPMPINNNTQQVTQQASSVMTSLNQGNNAIPDTNLPPNLGGAMPPLPNGNVQQPSSGGNASTLTTGLQNMLGEVF